WGRLVGRPAARVGRGRRGEGQERPQRVGGAAREAPAPLARGVRRRRRCADGAGGRGIGNLREPPARGQLLVRRAPLPGRADGHRGVADRGRGRRGPRRRGAREPRSG
ncbi:unnamed protein product, partial [Prorocentrum cordatum]